MDTTDQTSALAAYLALQPPEVVSNLRVVTPQRLRQPFVLHMSKNTQLTSFTPQVSRRVLSGENRTVPRVATAPTLAGCLLAYCSDLADFTNRQDGLSLNGERVKFRGGWGIYALPFDLALRPKRGLVPDVETTDEHWLVNYDADHVRYRGQLIGRFFYEQIGYLIRGRERITEVVMYVEVTDQYVRFDHRTVLTPGHWRLRVRGLHNAKRWNTIEQVEVEEIASGLYTSVKRNVASLLSLEDVEPLSASW